MNIGQAIEQAKQGKKIKRPHWGGYWFFVEKGQLSFYKNKDDDFPAGVTMNPTLVACLKDNGGFIQATPYMDDLLAEDWELVE